MSILLKFAQAIGFAPICMKKLKMNVLFSIFLFILNQVRFSIFVYCHFIVWEYTSLILEILKPISIILQNIFMSTLLLSPLTQFEKWQKLRGMFKKKYYESPKNKYLIFISVLGYLVVLLGESYVFFPLKRYGFMKVYPWTNYHLTQILNYFIFYVTKYLVEQVIRCYNDFKIKVDPDSEGLSKTQLKCVLRRKMCAIALRYIKIHEEVTTINEMFKWLLFVSISSLFFNILSTATLLIINNSITGVALMIFFICSGTQITVSLVSHSSMVFLNFIRLVAFVVVSSFLHFLLLTSIYL